MIYLNHAATSWPKPEGVLEALCGAAENPPQGQFRSSFSGNTEDSLPECREKLGKLLGIRQTGRIFFTSGSTEGLNAVFCGLGIPADQIITTVTEHNSVLRPLYNLRDIAGEPFLVPCDREGFIDTEKLVEAAATGRYKAIVLNHCSNVTGALQDAASAGKIAKEYGLLFILDVSQSAGCLPVRADEWNVDALAFTGHKALLGIQGTGGYYVRGGLPLVPFRYGGTGKNSSRIRYSEETYEYETGTQNLPGIAALSAALDLILEKGVPQITAQEKELTAYVAARLREIGHIRVIGHGKESTEIGHIRVIGHEKDGGAPGNHREYGPVISFVSSRYTPSDLAYILQNSFGIVTRAGLQCAPLIHSFLGTEGEGTLRISFSLTSRKEEVDALISALKELP